MKAVAGYLIEQLRVATWVPEWQLKVLHDPEDSVALLQTDHASNVWDLQVLQIGLRHNIAEKL